MVVTAWVDESGSTAAYMFGAVVLKAGDVPDARSAVALLRKPAETKVHWHGLSERRRDQIIGVMAKLPISTLVVVRLAEEGDRQERQRRKCMEYLLPALVGNGVEQVIMESRGSKDDQRDRDLLAALQAQHRIFAPALKMGHVRGVDDPLLWLPDALCGAVLNARRGDNRWWEPLAKSTSVLTFDAGDYIW